MTIPINQNQNRIPMQAGLSSLNSNLLNKTTTNAPAPAQNAAQAVPAQASQNPIIKPNSAYVAGVGAVPSGYFIQGEENHSSEDHIIKKTPLTGARIMADKITKDIFLYAPKGMQGSKNSNFYEFLSLGIVPNLIGCGMLIATSNAATKHFNPNSAKASAMNGANVAAGVVMYATMKWLGNKIMNKGVNALTGVDLEMPYKKVICELPENGKTRTATEFHRVYESVDFPRWDLINKQGEQNGNRYEYYDKIAKDKLNCEEPLNAPDQVVQPLIRKVLVKSTAAKSISSFLWAATGVAIAAQKPFTGLKHNMKPKNFLVGVGDIVQKIPSTLYESTKSLWKGSSKASGFVGKGLIIAAVASTVAGLVNVKRGFKIDKQQSKTKIDYTKDYTEN